MFTLRFALRNIMRNRLRSLVTLLGVATLLFLVSLLMSIVSGLAQARQPDPSARRLVVRHEVSLTINLPEAYWQRIRAIPHVVEVSPSNWFGGVYVDPKNFFARFFVDPDTFLAISSESELSLDAASKAAWKADRQGALVADSLAEKFGWKLGDRIVIRGDIYPVDVELNIRGIFAGDYQAIYFHRAYVEEALNRPGVVGTFAVEVDDPANLPGVARAIDEAFANSDAPTRSETESAFRAGFVSMMGDIEGLLKKLTLIIAVTMLLTAGNTMAMAVRERTTEVAILKAIGFLPSRIVGFILAESVALAGIAGLIGVGGFWGLSWFLFVKSGVRVPMLWFSPTLPLPTAMGLLLGSLALGLLAGIVPAVLASRRPVVDGLRRN